jgi:hypothetical protein
MQIFSFASTGLEIMSDCPPKVRGDKSPAQYMEALRAGTKSPLRADFHELRQDFSPTSPVEQDLQSGENHD